MPISATEFRDALGRFASGVTVITADHAGERRGMTASAFVSVSLDPPLILVSVDRKAHMHGVLEAAGGFAVNILEAGQQALSDHFAGRPDTALTPPWAELHGLPVLAGSLAQLACTLYRAYAGGDHTLFLGEVQAVRLAGGEPLAYHAGRYRQLAGAQEASP